MRRDKLWNATLDGKTAITLIGEQSEIQYIRTEHQISIHVHSHWMGNDACNGLELAQRRQHQKPKQIIAWSMGI